MVGAKPDWDGMLPLPPHGISHVFLIFNTLFILYIQMMASTSSSLGGRFKAIRWNLWYFPIIKSCHLLHFYANIHLPCSYLTPCFNLISTSQDALNLIPSCLFYDFPITIVLSVLHPFSLFAALLTSQYKIQEFLPLKKNPPWTLSWKRYMAPGYSVMCYGLLTLHCARTCPVMHKDLSKYPHIQCSVIWKY